jgi:hypothetical protein
MVKTDSLNAKVHTSMLFSHTNTTPEHLILVSVFTHLRYALRSISHPDLATSHELIMLFYNLLSLHLLSLELPQPKYVYTL